MLIGDLMRKNARWYADNLALVDVTEDVRLTWLEENERTNKAANALLGIGLNKGDRAAMLLKNSWYYWELYFSLGKSGIIGVPVNLRLHINEMVEYLNYVKPRAILTDTQHTETAMKLKNIVPGIEFLIGFMDNHGLDMDYEKMLCESSASDPEVDLNQDDPYIFGMTSGTTGKIKAVIATHRTATAATSCVLAESLGYSRTSSFLQNIPMYFNPGTMTCLAQALKGGTFVVYDGFTPERFMEIVGQEKITHSILVPTMVNMVVNHPDVHKYDLSSFKNITLGGSPLSQSQMKAAIKIFGNVFTPIYGSTETTAAVAMLFREDQYLEGSPEKVKRLASAGKPLVGVDVRVVDENNHDVPPGTAGEIVVRGESVVPGYWEMPEENKEAYRGGWFHTGDVGVIEDGFLYIVDRIKDIIITGGINVHSVEIEKVINDYPAVMMCAAIGVPDDKWGESIKVFVQLKPGQTASEEDIIMHCSQHLASYKKPKIVEFVDELPLSANGKILKRVLRKKYWQGKERRVQ